MALGEEELAARPDNLNLIPRTQVVGESDSCCPSSGLYKCIWYAHLGMHTHGVTPTPTPTYKHKQIQ